MINFTPALESSLSYTASDAGTIVFRHDGSGTNCYTWHHEENVYNNSESFNRDVESNESVVLSGNANNGYKTWLGL